MDERKKLVGCLRMMDSKGSDGIRFMGGRRRPQKKG